MAQLFGAVHLLEGAYNHCLMEKGRLMAEEAFDRLGEVLR